MATAATELPTPVAAEPPPVKEDPLAVLKALAEASAVFVAITYLGGWFYVSSYYHAFGLNRVELDIPIPVVSAVAVSVWYDSVWPLILAVILIVGFAIFSHRLPKFGRGAVVALVAALLLIAATAGVVQGRRNAYYDSLENSLELPNVAFASKLKDIGPGCVDFETYGSTDCKLLLHLKDVYYFFRPVPEEGIGNIDVYRLFDSDVLGVHEQQALTPSTPTRIK
jgi:hypothetical protein